MATEASSPCSSLYKGADATYSVDGGRASVTINADSRLKIRAVYVGIGQMRFWMKPNAFERGARWACETSMTDQTQVQTHIEVAEDGRQKIEADLQNVFPAGFILDRGLLGALAAPAVHIEVEHGKDIWVFLMRRPWFPTKFQVERQSLSLEHDATTIYASFGVGPDGNLSAQVSLDGAGFKKASLVVRRSLGSATTEEVVGEVEEGTQSFEWSPTTRDYNVLLVTEDSISTSQLWEVAGGLGADAAKSVFGHGLKQNFVLCDVPAISYSIVLKGHRGLLENSQDEMSAGFTSLTGA